MITRSGSSGSKREKLVSVRAAQLNHDYPTLENQIESLINGAISLTSMDDSSIKLKRAGESNNPYLHLARDGLRQKR